MGAMIKQPPVVWWIESGEDAGIFSDFHQGTCAWVRSLGLDPDRLGPQAAVVFYNGRYELHVDEILRHAVGEDRGDRWDPLDEDNLITIRRIIPVEEGSWPSRPVEVAAR